MHLLSKYINNKFVGEHRVNIEINNGDLKVSTQYIGSWRDYSVQNDVSSQARHTNV